MRKAVSNKLRRLWDAKPWEAAPGLRAVERNFWILLLGVLPCLLSFRVMAQEFENPTNTKLAATVSFEPNQSGETGVLRVFIHPGEVSSLSPPFNAPARWRFVGETEWRYGSNALSISWINYTVPTGSHTVEFKPVAGWTTPPPQEVLVQHDALTEITGTYTRPLGSLQVTIEPQAAIDAGAQWRRPEFGFGVWRNSGDIATSVPAGLNTIEFKPIPNWTTPTNQSVLVSENETASAVGVYLSGLLQVTITPQEAVDAGAQWRREGTTVWLNSGDIDSPVPAEPLTVEFKPVEGWTAPENLVVTVGTDEIGAFNATYVRHAGWLQVDIQPWQAVYAGGRWRLVGTTNWGYPVPIIGVNVPIGTYMVEFRDIAGWITPQPEEITITLNQLTDVQGIYVQQPGSLQVTLSPLEAIHAGAKWRRVGATAWLNSGDVEEDVPAGSHQVEFKAIDAWLTPADQDVSVSSNRMTAANAMYAPKLKGLLWSTYLGGTETLFDNGNGSFSRYPDGCAAVAVDAAGNAYVTGKTGSPGWVSGGLDLSHNGRGDAFAAKISSTGALIWATYLGGAGRDTGNGIALDNAGNVYVVGQSDSSGWISGGFDVTHGGGDDVFVVSLTGDGGFRWSTYLGGGDDDAADHVATDAQGNVYVTGSTFSSGWVSGGFDTSFGGNQSWDGFLVKLSGDGSHLWSTYLGGTGIDTGDGIALDNAGNVYVAGQTTDANWSIVPLGGTGSEDAFVTKVSNAGAHVWTSVFGGIGLDDARAIAADLQGNIYVAGDTESDSWITGGYDTAHGGRTDAFAAKFSGDGAMLWSTCIGGSDYDSGNAIALDGAGNIFVTGRTFSSGWVSGGFDTEYNAYIEAFVVKLTPDGGHRWSTYLGGETSTTLEGTDGQGIAVDTSGNIYVTGSTSKSGWTFGGFDTELGGTGDGFLAKMVNVNDVITGSLRVTIGPEDAVQRGAQWRRVGTANWLGSGVTESDVPVGPVAVEFEAISGWLAPEPETATITWNATANLGVVYLQYNAVAPDVWLRYE
jgi:hypothetical protein